MSVRVHLHGAWADLRVAGRRWWSDPLATTFAVAMLVLGLAGGVAVFAAVDAVLLAPLPYPDAARLVRLFETKPGSGRDRFGVSPGNSMDWRGRAQSFDGIALYRDVERLLSSIPDPDHVRGASVSPDLLAVLGVRPALGGGFSAGRAVRPDETDEVIISDTLWRRAFGSDPAVVGRQVVFDRVDSMTIVGVMPPGFRFPETAEFWVPLEVFRPMIGSRQRGERYRQCIARLRRGTSVEAARVEMAVIARQLAAEHPTVNAGWGVAVVPMKEVVVEASRPGLFVAAAAVTSCLVLVCANLAALLLVRGLQRRRELAIRSAVGATPWLLARQLLAEGLLLAAVAGVASVGLAHWLLSGLVAAMPADSARLAGAAIDLRALAVAAGLTLTTALVIGMAPALRVSKADPLGLLGRKARPVGRRFHVHSWLVSTQVAIALGVVVVGGLFVRSYVGVSGTDLGFDGEGVVSADVRVVGLGERRPWFRLASIEGGLLSRLRMLPNVQAVGTTTDVPLAQTPVTAYVAAADPLAASTPGPSSRGAVAVARHTVSSGYFSAVGVGLARGRVFSDADAFSERAWTTPGATKERPVAIVSESLARRLWPGEDPIGKSIALDFDMAETARTVIGVVGDVRYAGAERPSLPEVYLPVGQAPTMSFSIVVRSAADLASTVAMLRKEIRGFHVALSVRGVTSVDALVDRSQERIRFLSLLIGGLSALALLVAASGVYSVVALSVGRRTREFAVRLALGADRRGILWLALGEGVGAAAIGAALGLALAWVSGLAVEGMLVGVGPSDPAAVVGGVALLMTAAAVAALIPARRAERLDPTHLLRGE